MRQKPMMGNVRVGMSKFDQRQQTRAQYRQRQANLPRSLKTYTRSFFHTVGSFFGIRMKTPEERAAAARATVAAKLDRAKITTKTALVSRYGLPTRCHRLSPRKRAKCQRSNRTRNRGYLLPGGRWISPFDLKLLAGETGIEIGYWQRFLKGGTINWAALRALGKAKRQTTATAA